MPRERTCDFTGEEIEAGTGITFIRNDGTVLHFKDSKAEKNYFMGRDARDLEWTEAGQRAAQARSDDAAEPEPESEEPESEPEPDLEAGDEPEEPEDADGTAGEREATEQ